MSEVERRLNGVVRGQRERIENESGAGRLAACLVLAGGLRPSPLAAATGVSPLDLHVTGQSTVLDWWLERFAALADGGEEPLDVRVIHGVATPAPARPPKVPPGLRLRIEHETRQYRGPAGIARDVCSEYSEDAFILIAEAGRLVATDLREVVKQHNRRKAEITVVCNADSSPAGLFLARRSTLDMVPRIGFMDLKEQWLAKAVTRRLQVRVHRLPATHPSYELRTASQFRTAAQAAASVEATETGKDAERKGDDGLVGSGVVVVDSVIMPGASIGRDCVIVRSIICPGARIQSGATVIDQVVRGSGREPRVIAGRHAGCD